MIINVKVRPDSGNNDIVKQDDFYIINLRESAENNKANIELIKVLSKYFNCDQMNIRIKRGKTSRKKMIEVNL